MQGRWDDKSDDQIIYAWKDNWDWQRMWNGFSEPKSGTVLNAIAKGEERFKTLIAPQMERRGLSIPAPPISKYGYRHGKEI